MICCVLNFSALAFNSLGTNVLNNVTQLTKLGTLTFLTISVLTDFLTYVPSFAEFYCMYLNSLFWRLASLCKKVGHSVSPLTCYVTCCCLLAMSNLFCTVKIHIDIFWLINFSKKWLCAIIYSIFQDPFQVTMRQIKQLIQSYNQSTFGIKDLTRQLNISLFIHINI